jgi:cobalt-zinc-cadmium efflux system membrane fusion protein
MSQASVEDLARTGEIAPRYTVHAPIDGQVVEREVTLGELVSPDREALMVLADTSTLWVLADVPEARLHEVAPGAKAWIMMGSAAGRRFEGQVAFIAPLVDAGTRTAQVRIEVPAAASGGLMLKPGMFAQVEVVATDPANPEPVPTVAVPDEAVQTVEGGPAVFVPVKGEPTTYAKGAVTVGPSVGGLVPILAGLVEGEEFVITGTFILKAELGKGSAAHEH